MRTKETAPERTSLHRTDAREFLASPCTRFFRSWNWVLQSLQSTSRFCGERGARTHGGWSLDSQSDLYLRAHVRFPPEASAQASRRSPDSGNAPHVFPNQGRRPSHAAVPVASQFSSRQENLRGALKCPFGDLPNLKLLVYSCVMFQS